MSGSITNGGTIGSGSDAIVLNIAEDQALGVDAEFTVNVDGQQIGGLQTATALQSAGQEEAFTFLGNYAPGTHTITVTFANNFIYPGLSGDRNLYVDGVTYDGQTISNTTTGVYQSPLFPPNSTQGDVYGNAVYTVNDTTPIPAGAPSTPTTTPAAVSVGSGSDTLVLQMAEDAYDGDAQFTVTVDGQQVGGTLTTTAIVGEGQEQEFDIHGNWGSGTHSVGVTFTNDAVGGYYPGTDLGLDTADRNLYIMGVSLDGGAPAAGTPWEQASDGTETFTVTAGNDPSATGPGAAINNPSTPSSPPTSPAPPAAPGSTGQSANDTVITAGSGGTITDSSGDTFTIDSNDQMVLNGNVVTSTANVAELAYVNDGVWQENTAGNWWTESGQNAPNGEGTSISPLSGSTSSGSTSSGSTASSTSSSGTDSLTINAAGLAVGGVQPQFLVTVDGNQVGGTNTASATESSGGQAFTFTGDFGSGQHSIGIQLLNGAASAGGTGSDLYVNSITLDGNTTNEYGPSGGSVQAGYIDHNGTTYFTVTAGSTPATT